MSARRQVPPGQGFGKLICGAYWGSPRVPPRRSFGGHLDGTCEAGGRGLGQQADGVAAKGRRVFVAGPVVVVHGVRHDARLALALQFEGHRAAEQGRLAPDERILVRVDGVVVRRHEEARAVAAHLVHREKHLGVPLAREEARERPALGHVQHEHVAVDVVAHVLVVRPRHLSALERRALRLLLPVRDQHVAIGVQRRDQDHDDPVQHLDGAFVARGGELVQEVVRRLRRANLAGVDAAADGDHRLRAGHDGLHFAIAGQLPRVSQQAVVDLQRGQVPDVVHRADDRADDAAALGCRADIHQFDARRGGGHGFKVLGDRRPVRELPVGAHLEAEERLGRRHLRGGGQRSSENETKNQHDVERGSAACHRLFLAPGP